MPEEDARVEEARKGKRVEPPEERIYVVPGVGFGNHHHGTPKAAQTGIYYGRDTLSRNFIDPIDGGSIPKGSVVRHDSIGSAVQHYGRLHKRATSCSKPHKAMVIQNFGGNGG